MTHKKLFSTFVSAFLLTILIVPAVGAINRKMPAYSLTGSWKEPLVLPEGRQNLKEQLAKDIQTPEEANWDKLKTFYNFSKALPQPTKTEFSYQTGFISKKTINTKHIPSVFSEVYNAKFTDPKYGLKNPPTKDQLWLRSFGDMMAKFKTVRGKPQETKTLLKIIQTSYPKIWSEVNVVLSQLVNDEFLYSEKWDPWKDGSPKASSSNDGLLFMPYWKMKPNANRPKYWNGDLSEHKVYQGGVFIYAPLQKIKAVERDYAKYAKHVGMGYLAAAPLKGTYWKGKDDKGDEFIALELFVRQDPTFPL